MRIARNTKLALLTPTVDIPLCSRINQAHLAGYGLTENKRIRAISVIRSPFTLYPLRVEKAKSRKICKNPNDILK